MIYGEFGRFPLKNKIYSRIINYWKRNIESKQQTLSVIIYKYDFSMYENDAFISRWIVNVKHILDLAGLSYIWVRQFDSNINRKWLSQKMYKNGINIPRKDKTFFMCNQGCIGDKFHFLFKCNVLNDLRKRYLSTYYCKHPSVIKNE